jgi:hypothetical protein
MIVEGISKGATPLQDKQERILSSISHLLEIVNCHNEKLMNNILLFLSNHHTFF